MPLPADNPRRLRFIHTAAVLLLVCMALSGGCGRETPPPRPPVVFISLDTTRPDYLSAYGHPWSKTAIVDGLAAQGVLFEDALSPATTTLAAHSSMMTGTYPHRHGVPRNGFVLADENSTLAEVLRAEGYYCAGFVGGFPLSSRFNLSQGFDTYNDDMTDPVRGARANVNGYERSAGAVNRAVAAFLDGYDEEQPLFLFVHYFDPHYPYRPPEDVLARYRDVAPEPPVDLPAVKQSLERLAAAADYSIVPRIVNRYGADFAGADALGVVFEALRMLPRLEQRYAAEIAYVDDQLGNLFDALKDRGLFDDALIVLTSDHGETLWDHTPFFDHGNNVYHAEAQAVGVVKLPSGAHGGRRVSAPISTLDWMPSILGYLRIDAPRGLDGRDLRFADGADAPSGRILFSEATKPHRAERAGNVWPNARKAQGAYRAGYKFIAIPYRNEAEFYNLRDDPKESENLVHGEALPPRAGKLRRGLEAWQAEADPFTIREPEEDLDETREALEALGYVE